MFIGKGIHEATGISEGRVGGGFTLQNGEVKEGSEIQKGRGYAGLNMAKQFCRT